MNHKYIKWNQSFRVVENNDACRIVKLLETYDQLIAKYKLKLVPFDELKCLADKNTTLIGNFGYTFMLNIYYYLHNS